MHPLFCTILHFPRKYQQAVLLYDSQVYVGIRSIKTNTQKRMLAVCRGFTFMDPDKCFNCDSWGTEGFDKKAKGMKFFRTRTQHLRLSWVQLKLNLAVDFTNSYRAFVVWEMFFLHCQFLKIEVYQYKSTISWDLRALILGSWKSDYSEEDSSPWCLELRYWFE